MTLGAGWGAGEPARTEVTTYQGGRALGEQAQLRANEQGSPSPINSGSPTSQSKAFKKPERSPSAGGQLLSEASSAFGGS